MFTQQADTLYLFIVLSCVFIDYCQRKSPLEKKTVCQKWWCISGLSGKVVFGLRYSNLMY